MRRTTRPPAAYQGVDPNRNYGGFWGGPGAERGSAGRDVPRTGPFSEPETQNIRELFSERQVTNLITNHTYSNLLLRPPGSGGRGSAARRAPAGGPRSADGGHNGYANEPWLRALRHHRRHRGLDVLDRRRPGLHVRDRRREFHPPYERAWWPSTSDRPRRMGPARAATARPTTRCSRPPPRPRPLGGQGRGAEGLDAEDQQVLHDLHLAGVAEQPRHRDRRRECCSPTRSRATLRSDGGRFTWDVNPSTRPLVAGRYGRDATGPPQAAIPLANPAGVPAENTGELPERPQETFRSRSRARPRWTTGG